MISPGVSRRRCPLCNSTAAREKVRSRNRAETAPVEHLRTADRAPWQEKLFFTYHRCIDCGLLYTPYFLRGAPPVDGYSRFLAADAVQATQRGYFDAAKAAAPLTGGYLEIAPDAGHIVRDAARQGSFDHFWLIEPNAAAHDTLRAATLGAPVTLSSDMAALGAVPDRSIGLAVMVHVLDHLLDPLGLLAQVRRKLRPGGTLMIVAHNEKSVLRSVMGVRWPPFCLQHPALYNPATLQRLLRRAGYVDIDVARSANHVPIDFLAKQAVWTMGMKVERLPLPSLSIGLRLGNMITLATTPVQAGAAPAPKLKRLESAA